MEKLGLGAVATKALTDSLGSSEAGVPFRIVLGCGKEIERNFIPSNCSQKRVWPWACASLDEKVHKADSRGCLLAAFLTPGGISPPVLKGIWVVLPCVHNRYSEIREKGEMGFQTKGKACGQESLGLYHEQVCWYCSLV